MAEHVILVAGEMGAGKTTAIVTLSEIEVVRTEALNTEREVVDKDTTTVALDYGEIGLDSTSKLRLYGVPGQRRFDFMWSILKRRAVGLLLLVKNDSTDPTGRMIEFLDEFGEIYGRGGVVVGVTHMDVAPSPSIADHQRALRERFPELAAPVFTVDPRNRPQLVTALSVLAASVETRQRLISDGRDA